MQHARTTLEESVVRAGHLGLHLTAGAETTVEETVPGVRQKSATLTYRDHIGQDERWTFHSNLYRMQNSDMMFYGLHLCRHSKLEIVVHSITTRYLPCCCIEIKRVTCDVLQTSQKTREQCCI